MNQSLYFEIIEELDYYLKNDEKFVEYNKCYHKNCKSCLTTFVPCKEKCDINLKTNNNVAVQSTVNPVTAEKLDGNFRNKLHLYASRGDAARVENVLRNREVNVLKRTRGNLPVLFFAIKGGCTRVVQHLIDYGCDVNEIMLNYVKKKPTPALHFAVEQDNLKVCI